jgi:hypothetical protein
LFWLVLLFGVGFAALASDLVQGGASVVLLGGPGDREGAARVGSLSEIQAFATEW